jgi:hypothetical protein
MKKATLLLVLLALMLIAGFALFAPRDPYAGIPGLSIIRLTEAEADWYEAGVASYRVVVDISFSGEKRRHWIVVRNNLLESAETAGWDGEAWGAPQAMGAEDAAFYTIPGLFQTVRLALQNEQVAREAYRMSAGGEPPIPRVIYFSEIIQEGEPVEGTALLIEVVEFEALP